MNPLPRLAKKGLRDQASQEPRRQCSDHDLFSLEYLNNTMNYLLPGKNDFSHTYRLNSDIFEEIIGEDVANLGVLFSERLKQMKPTCSPNFYSRDVQEYGDFINHELSKSHQREIQSIERQLRDQVQFGMAMKRVKRRYPWVDTERVSLEEGKRLIGSMKEEILQSLLGQEEFINEDTFERELQKNRLYRELFSLGGGSAGEKQRSSQVVNVKYMQNDAGSIEPTVPYKPRKGRRPKKALQQRDLEYKPNSVEKFVKKVRMGSSRWGDNSEKPSKIEEQSENNPDAFAKQSDANSKSKMREENVVQEPLFKQTKVQMAPENIDASILDTVDKAKDMAVQGHLELRTEAVVAVKRRHRVEKDRVEGQSQNDKKSQKQAPVAKKRGRKRAEVSVALPPPSVSPIYSPHKPNVAEIGVQANPNGQWQQNGLTGKIVVAKSADPLLHASTEIKRATVDEIQEQPKVQARQSHRKREEASRSDQQMQQELSQRLRVMAPEQFEQQKQEDANADPLDFIDECFN